jgi:hypothetical protein
MMKIAIAAVALALGALPGLASAQAVEEKNLLSGKASIDAESGLSVRARAGAADGHDPAPARRRDHRRI